VLYKIQGIFQPPSTHLVVLVVPDTNLVTTVYLFFPITWILGFEKIYKISILFLSFLIFHFLHWVKFCIFGALIYSSESQPAANGIYGARIETVSRCSV
jgi:hypothetical protein